jgi:hypothetical protein
MKLIISLIFTFVSFSLYSAERIEVKYSCTSNHELADVKYLLFRTTVDDTTKVQSEQVILASELEVNESNFREELVFTIKVKDSEQFITLKNKVQLNPETYGETSLEFNEDFALNHKTELEVESCGADYSGENCLIIESYQCSLESSTESPIVIDTLPAVIQ